MTGDVRETYHAAVQHDLVDLDGDERLVGVVRRPTAWFGGAVDENRPTLGPPEALLDEVQARKEELKLRGMCDEGAHNAAWEETNFERRYREYLDDSGEAEEDLQDLVGFLENDETVVLVCYEGDDKRCHRRVIREELADRVGG